MNVVSETGDNLEEIYAWIEQMTFSKPKKNLARDFSDGGTGIMISHCPAIQSLIRVKISSNKILVFMAELLKRYYPRHVDIHNYISGNSISKKIDNWCTLNRKVLSKLDIKLGRDVINQLANSQPGVIERVLTDLRVKILKDCNAERDSMYSQFENSGEGEIVRSVLDSEEVANKTVPRHVFVRLKQESEEKNEVINSLRQKISHLESLMKLKDQRIADLTAQTAKTTEPCATPRNDNSTHTSSAISIFRAKI